ncbi:DUF6059 family protein [Streptomyces sp. NPDC002838]|uniref:DUF6059 family protein n=1 Tax=Streptomyces sp. NPDC002838 TaxID=3154436 RepID=UPI0033244DD0
MRGALLWRYRALVLLNGFWRALTAYGSFWVAPGHPEYTALVLRSGDPPPGHPERRRAGIPLTAEERALERRMYAAGGFRTDHGSAREDTGSKRKRFPPGDELRPRGTP